MVNQCHNTDSKEHLRSILEDLRSDPDETNMFVTIGIILRQARRIDRLQSQLQAAEEADRGAN